jgi:N-acetylmuramoyl-L-alanine amidase
VISAPPPPITEHLVPFGEQRKADTAAYARRHYGIDDWRVRDPKVIVIHYTVNGSLQATFDTFAPNRPDVELGERPGLCSHFGVGQDGAVWQFARLATMCRHTVGLNWTALGVEFVGFSAQEVLGRPRQLRRGVQLVQWLRCREGIGVGNVIGHNESLRSPYHRERFARLRTQTHGDWTRGETRRFRREVRKLGPCA